MPSWFDVDAPDTNWRADHEDPIPLLLGRWPITGFLYRWFACRPLDGHARTDAGFLTPGTKAFTKTGRAHPYQFWPGWKRGLFTRLPVNLLLLSLLTAYLLGGWAGLGLYLHVYWTAALWLFTW